MEDINESLMVPRPQLGACNMPRLISDLTHQHIITSRVNSNMANPSSCLISSRIKPESVYIKAVRRPDSPDIELNQNKQSILTGNLKGQSLSGSYRSRSSLKTIILKNNMVQSSINPMPLTERYQFNCTGQNDILRLRAHRSNRHHTTLAAPKKRLTLRALIEPKDKGLPSPDSRLSNNFESRHCFFSRVSYWETTASPARNKRRDTNIVRLHQ